MQVLDYTEGIEGEEAAVAAEEADATPVEEVCHVAVDGIVAQIRSGLLQLLITAHARAHTAAQSRYVSGTHAFLHVGEGVGEIRLQMMQHLPQSHRSPSYAGPH